MIKKIRLLLFFYFIFFATIFSKNYENYPSDIKKILERGELRVAMTANDVPPFYFKNKNNKLIGFDVELAKKMADELGVSVKFDRSSKTFNDVVEKVFNGKADIAISKLSRTLNRAKKIRFSKPYIVFYQGLLINRLGLAKQVKDINELSIAEFLKNYNKKIGVIKSSSYVNYTHELFPNAKIVEYNTWEPDIVNAVLNGEILMAYRDELEIKKIIKGYSDASLKLKTVILKDQKDEIAMAISWENTHFLAWVNIFLENQQLNLTAEKLLNQYPDIFKKN